MVKKLLTFVFGLGLTLGVAAQGTISHDDIQFWVGQGDAHAIVAIQWDNDEVGLAWGVQYDSEEYLTVQDALDSIKLYDPRFNYQFSIYSGYMIMGFSSLTYDDGTLSLSKANTEIPQVWVEGTLYSATDWDFDAAVEEEDGIILISTGGYEVYTGITPVTPPAEPAEESTIAASDILFWVGEGSNEAIFVIEWNTGARAWGYHFNTGATIQNMFDDIEAADPRFANAWGTVAYTEYPVREDLTNYRVKANGEFVQLSTPLTNNMFVKVGTPQTNVWAAPITPATVVEVPVDATVAQSDILYWAGEGADSMIVALAFGERNLSYAWGLKFTAPITVSEAILALAAADERVSVETLAGSIQNISYVRGEDTISFTPSTSPLNMMQFILDGDGWAGWTSEAQNGSFLKIGESAYATGVDTTWSSYGGYPSYVVWPTKINLVGPVVESATISAEDIVYWVGEGSNQIVFVVNWADTALAWGYRFNTESVSMQTVMDDIAAADHRFSYELGDYGVGDIKFAVAAGDTLRGTSWWGHELNNMMSAGLAQPMANGDFSRWYDGSVAIAVEGTWVEAWGGYYEYTNAFPQTIYPVSAFVSIDEVAGIDMQVYPNPANEQLNVTFDAMKSNATAAVYDMAGRMVYSQAVAAGADRISINTAAFNGGVYMLRIGNAAAKIVVRH